MDDNATSLGIVGPNGIVRTWFIAVKQENMLINEQEEDPEDWDEFAVVHSRVVNTTIKEQTLWGGISIIHLQTYDCGTGLHYVGMAIADRMSHILAEITSVNPC